MASRTIELVHLKEKEEAAKHFDLFTAFWFNTFAMLFHATRGFAGHKNT